MVAAATQSMANGIMAASSVASAEKRVRNRHQAVILVALGVNAAIGVK